MFEFDRILIVDDSAMMRSVVRKSLSMAKVKAREFVDATDGLEALHLLKQASFDIVFCDLNMPTLTGDELIKQLMLLEAERIPPIVVVSSEANSDRIDRLHCDHVIGVLRKPFSPEQIVELLANIANHEMKEVVS